MSLFIVNGPFAVGKSTVARLLHQQFPLALLISVDDLRRLFHRYREFWRESLYMSEEIARAVARVALANGRVAIVEGVKIEDAQLDPWLFIGQEYKVPVHEILLWSSKETVLRRAAERGISPNSMLTLDLVSWAWDAIATMRSRRSGVLEWNTEIHTPEEIVNAICRRAATLPSGFETAHSEELT